MFIKMSCSTLFHSYMNSGTHIKLKLSGHHLKDLIYTQHTFQLNTQRFEPLVRLNICGFRAAKMTQFSAWGTIIKKDL